MVADDFGLHASYDRGILDAAAAGAIDAASVMVLRSPGRIGELIATGVAVGLHLEGLGPPEMLDEQEVRSQIASFERLAARPPDFLDGHHHCHAAPAAAPLVAAIAARSELPVRSVDPEHRRILRAAGIRTPDLLIGRYEETQPVLPAELGDPPTGARSIEWMVHPGHPDPWSGSGYDRGRGEDLEAVLGLEVAPGWVRGDHRDLPAP